MKARILWLDEDKSFVLVSHRQRLEIDGYDVDRAYSLSDCLYYLGEGNYDLFILDVIVPVSEHEEQRFPREKTQNGKLSGLVFYEMFQNVFEEKHTEVMVYTIRDDKEVREAFVKAGLEPELYVIKQEVADTAEFVEKVRKILKAKRNGYGEKPDQGGGRVRG